jgi:hypothetical protein
MDKSQNIPYTVSRMKTVEDRLRFAIEFSQKDLEQIRPGDLMNLRDDLYLFAFTREPGDIFATTDEEDADIRNLSIEDLKALQRETQIALIHFASPSPAHRVSLLSGSQISVSLSLNRDDQRKVLCVAGSPRDCFLMVLYLLLSKEPVGRIRICPGCSEVFYKVKKQKYCSRRCSNRVYMRQYRKTDNGKDEVSKSNKKAYEKRTEKRYGKKFKFPPRRKP